MDPSLICENGMIKPGFEPFVPAGFDRSLVKISPSHKKLLLTI